VASGKWQVTLATQEVSMREKGLLKFIDRFVGVPIAFLLGTTSRLWQPRRILSQGAVCNILIIKLSAVGDSILAVPAWRSLRERFCQSGITVICSSVTHDTLSAFPFFDDIIHLNIEKMVRKPRALFGFLRDLRSREFDLVIDFDQWMRMTALLSFATGAPKRVGFDTKDQHRRFCYTHTVRPSEQRHEVNSFMDLAVAAGAARGSRELQMWIPDEDLAAARDTISYARRDSRIVVAFHPGCGGSGTPRQWPADAFVNLGKKLTESSREIAVVVTGSPGEIPLAEEIANRIGDRCISLAGAQSITRFAALLKCCNLLVCGNTGAMHVAAAVGVPTVALHGPTNPHKWGPVGDNHVVIQSPIPCSPCLDLGFDYGCTSHPCMGMITVDGVFDAVSSRLARLRSGDEVSL